jgi:hypothetical protein
MEEENSSPDISGFFLHAIDLMSARVIMSYCPRCGKFVAASPDLKIILIAEAHHDCG